MFSQQLQNEVSDHPNAIVGWLLLCSYAYYHRYTSLIPDELFDELCKRLLTNYDTINHKYKHLLTKDALEAGTAYHIGLDDYPDGIIRIAEKMIREVNS